MTDRQANPFFSIILPTFNRANIVSNAIESVISQTFPDWELLVIDDGSTDNSKEIINQIAADDRRITYFFQENKERSAARNRGVKESKGQYICFLDSDDFYYSNHLAILFEQIKLNEDPIGVFYTGIHFLKNGKIQNSSVFFSGDNHPTLYVLKNFLFIDSVCAHRDCFSQNLFPEQFSIWEDTHLWLRIVSSFPFFPIPEYTTAANLHDSSTVHQFRSELSLGQIKRFIAVVEDLFSNFKRKLHSSLTDEVKKEYLASQLLGLQWHAMHSNQRLKSIYLLTQCVKYKLTPGLAWLYFTRLIKTLFSRANF